MGFYIRKSWTFFKVVRINLSKGGVGVSVGLKGLRVGVNRHGPYFHVGWGGLYYRSYLFKWRPVKVEAEDP